MDHMCGKCTKMCGWLLLIIGVLYLWADLSASFNLWGINWWTFAFLLFGLAKVGSSCCSSCQSCSMPEASAKRKR